MNSLVGFNIGKKTEFVHAENARSKTIGTIEKREGQVVLGLTTSNQPFITTANYALPPFTNGQISGLYRISVTQNSILSINVEDVMTIFDTRQMTGVGTVSYQTASMTISVKDSVTVQDIFNENTGTVSTIYYINSMNQWVPLSGSGTNIPGGQFDYTYAEGNLFLVNFNSLNRYISNDGVTVTTSADGTGHLFNSPPASMVNYYKNRLYLGDFTYKFTRYKTTILRSSYPLGIVALVNADVTSSTTITVTDNKYFYTDSGANSYDIYRGPNLITTVTVTAIQNLSITVSNTVTLLASDEIWVAGTYGGTKVFRWVNNASITGRDVKQYDTFKLVGGENSPITMIENIGNVMLIANSNSIASWNDYVLENFDLSVGCVSKNGHIKLLGTLYFLYYNGIYSTSGSVPQLISNKVEKYITGATKSGKELCATGKKGHSVFFTLGDVTLYKPDGSVNKILKDVCLEYNTIQENWFVHTNVKATEFSTYVESTDTDRLELADNSGNHAIKEFLSGESDDGSEIPLRLDTMKLTMQSSWENLNNLISLLVDVDRGSSSQVFVSIDDSDYYPLPGNLRKGLSEVKIMGKDDLRGQPPIARLVSFSIRDNSKQLCKFSRMSLIFIPVSNDDPVNDN